MASDAFNALFLCTGNSARSSMAEAIDKLDRRALQRRLQEIGGTRGGETDA